MLDTYALTTGCLFNNVLIRNLFYPYQAAAS
jgi:hypothetical protein